MTILRRPAATLPVLVLALLAGACSSAGEDAAEPPAANLQESASAEESASAQESAPVEGTAPAPQATPEDAPSAQAEAPEGYETRSGDGFSVAVPAGWEDFDPAQADLEAGIDEAGVEDPAQREALLAQVRQAAAVGIDLLAVDPVSAASGYADNANVVCQPGAPDTLDDLAPGIVSNLESSGATEVATTRPEIGGREALRIAYLLPTFAAAGVQYHIIADGEVCSLTVTTNGEGGVEGAEELAEPIGASFRLEG